MNVPPNTPTRQPTTEPAPPPTPAKPKCKHCADAYDGGYERCQFCGMARVRPHLPRRRP